MYRFTIFLCCRCDDKVLSLINVLEHPLHLPTVICLLLWEYVIWFMYYKFSLVEYFYCLEVMLLNFSKLAVFMCFYLLNSYLHFWNMDASNSFWIHIFGFAKEFVNEIYILMQMFTMYVVIKYSQYKIVYKNFFVLVIVYNQYYLCIFCEKLYTYLQNYARFSE